MAHPDYLVTSVNILSIVLNVIQFAVGAGSGVLALRAYRRASWEVGWSVFLPAAISVWLLGDLFDRGLDQFGTNVFQLALLAWLIGSVVEMYSPRTFGAKQLTLPGSPYGIVVILGGALVVAVYPFDLWTRSQLPEYVVKQVHPMGGIPSMMSGLCLVLLGVRILTGTRRRPRKHQSTAVDPNS